MRTASSNSVNRIITAGKDAFASANSILQSIFRRMENLSRPQIVLILFLVTFGAAAPMIIGYAIDNNPGRSDLSDIQIFRDRANTILDGEILYKDTEMVTVTPPLINYLFVPAILLGDSLIIWELWFTFFVFLTSISLFFALEPFFEKKLAIAGSAVYASSPFAVFTSVSMLQDDAIIVVFICLAMAFLLREKWYWAASMLGAGTMTKLFPALCSPLAVIAPNNWNERIRAGLIGFGIALLISLPFLILANDGFIQFVEFYVLGKQPPSSDQVSNVVSIADQRGMSLWRFLAVEDIIVPTSLLHSLLFIAIITIWIFAGLKKIDVMSAFTLCILSIFIFYSKLHYGYHMMLMVVLIPWALHSSWRMLGLLGASMLGRTIHLAWVGRLDSSNDILNIIYAFILWCYWIYWAWLIIKNPRFKDHCEKQKENPTMLATCGWIIITSVIISIHKGITKAM